MIKTEYPSLREVSWDCDLPCGCHLRVVPKKGFSRTHAFYAVHYGSVDTEFFHKGEKHKVPAGVAHYLEHKMFDMPYGDAMNRFARFGGSPNAFTGYEMTAYYVDCTENFEDNLKTLLEMVATPCFSEESIEKERGIIAQEIRMYEDSSDSRVYENIAAAMFPNHPVSIPIAGTVDSIGDITKETLSLCYDAFYAPENAMLCVVGDVEPELVEKIAEEYLHGASEAPGHNIPAASPTALNGKKVEQSMEISMPSFVAGFRAEPMEDVMLEEFIGDLAADVLLSVTSPLYNRLYNDGLADGSLSAGMESVRGACYLSVSGDSKDPQALLELLLEQASRIAEDGIDEAYFERQKKAYIGRMIRDLDGFENICYRSCYYYFYGRELFDLQKVFHSVQKETVRNFVSRWVNRGHCVLSVINPLKDEEK